MKKIVYIFNMLWWTCIVINVGSMMWYVLGSTAYFQRGVDLVATVILVICGIPSFILILYSLYMLKNGGVKSPYSMLGVAVILLIIILLSMPFLKFANI